MSTFERTALQNKRQEMCFTLELLPIERRQRRTFRHEKVSCPRTYRKYVQETVCLLGAVY